MNTSVTIRIQSFKRFKIQCNYINELSKQVTGQMLTRKRNTPIFLHCFDSNARSVHILPFNDHGKVYFWGKLSVNTSNFAPSHPGEQRSTASAVAMSEWRHWATRPVTRMPRRASTAKKNKQYKPPLISDWFNGYIGDFVVFNRKV